MKTRLVPPLTHAQAADVARSALVDTLRTASAVSAVRRLIALDGAPGGWLPAGWQTVPQASGGLDLRLAAAFAAATPDRPALLVGMDTPQFTVGQVEAFDPQRYDACLGLAADGGYWTIGYRDPAGAATTIPGVPMSRADTGACQLARMRADGLRVQMLESLVDVDTFATAQQVARQVPDSGFARTVDAARLEAVR